MLLKRKSEEGLSDWEIEAKTKVRRSSIREQRNTSTLQVKIAENIRILPYAYFQEARFHQEGKAWEINLYWPSVIVTVKGENLDRMVGLVAEQSLSSLEFRSDGEKSPRDDDPDFESLTLTPRSEGPFPPPPAEAKSQEGPKAIYRQCYSVV